MDNYVTGSVIKELRESKKMTQAVLANTIGVSDKTVSKWETGKGLPDISLIEPLSKALNVSTFELLKGKYVVNSNISCNMLKTKFSVCPICSNVIFKTGENISFCHGINLPDLEAEDENMEHIISVENVENELYVSINHEMSKNHYISFIAYVTSDRIDMVKMYPQQNAEARFFNRGSGLIYIYCNKDGLIKKKI